MEDYRIDLVIGQGPGARIHPFQLNHFTLVGATTRAGLITAPLRSRFGIVHRLEYYRPEDLLEILRRSATILNIRAGRGAARKKWPSAAAARRAWPIACCGACAISPKCARRAASPADVAREALDRLGVDAHGLDEVDRNLMLTIIQKFSGGPVGLNTIAASLSEEEDAIEEIYEPYLMQMGLLDRTQRGRVATPLAYKHFGIEPPRAQHPLFSESSSLLAVSSDEQTGTSSAQAARKRGLHRAGIECWRSRGNVGRRRRGAVSRRHSRRAAIFALYHRGHGWTAAGMVPERGGGSGDIADAAAIAPRRAAD